MNAFTENQIAALNQFVASDRFSTGQLMNPGKIFFPDREGAD